MTEKIGKYEAGSLANYTRMFSFTFTVCNANGVIDQEPPSVESDPFRIFSHSKFLNNDKTGSNFSLKFLMR